MEILDKNSILDDIHTVATIGFFDGFHLGHKFLLNSVLDFAKRENKKSLLITFNENPKKFFKQNYDIRQLNTVDEKIDKLSHFGIDYCLLLEFTEELSRKTASDFLNFLKKNFGLSVLFVGYDHTFGSDKIKDFEQIKSICNSLEIDAFKIDQFNVENQKVSSSLIRQLIENGEIVVANRMLGYDYSFNGIVVEGQKIGRTIGFPTANIDVLPDKLLPRNGVYAVEVIVGNQRKGGMLNIGNRPTLCGINRTVEVNIFDFEQYIYGQRIIVEIKKFMREEKKFDSLENLKNQLFIDKKLITNFLKGI